MFLSGSQSSSVVEIIAIDLATGQQRWSLDASRYGLVLVAATDETLVYATDEDEGSSLHAIDTATGAETIWTRTVPRYVADSPTIADGAVHIGSANGEAQAIDLTTGEPRWNVQAGGPIAGPIFVMDGTAAFISTDGNLYVIGADGTDDAAATGEPIDVSGLPACDISPLPALVATPATRTGPDVVAGTPRATYAEHDAEENRTDPPTIALADVPVGEPLAPADATAISDTLNRMRSCARSGDPAILAAFHSADYFRREWAAYHIAANAIYPVWYPSAPADTPDSIAATGVVLPDGRVAIPIDRFTSSVGPEQVIILTNVGGQWLIDEQLTVTPTGRPLQG